MVVPLDVVGLQNKIIAHPEYIEDLLNDMGFEHIVDRGNYYSFQNIGGDNPKAVVIYKDNLRYENFSHGLHGSIFTLIMETKNCSFPESLKYVSYTLGIQAENIKIILPFGGFYKQLIQEQSDEIVTLKAYSEDDLPDKNSLSWKYLKDGVSLQVQQLCGIRYSHEDNAILTPIYDIEHRLVGCKARNNDPDVDLAHRWYMYIPYKKTNVVYGMDLNYKFILQHETGILFEAEKSVMQCLSFDLRIGMAIGGHSFSKQQVRLIKMMNIKTIIVAFDQDLNEEEIIYESRKLLINTQNYSNRVFYIYDREGIYMPKGSKLSPSDQGKDIFLKLLKNCKYEVFSNG